jgi:multicomponent Na+:H+ antiporter subunit D
MSFLLHAPILQIIIPLLMAPVIILLRNRELAWGLAMMSTLAVFALTVHLFINVNTTAQPIVYELGNWPAPIGIVYVIDAANAYVLPLIAGISVIATYAARSLVNAEIDPRDHALFYAAWLLTIAGMLGQVATGDAFNIFVFLEISSLSAYALVAIGAGNDRRALPAAFNYLILGTIGATFYVIGVGLLYMVTGTLNIEDLSQRLPAIGDTHTGFAALAFISLGMFLKMALFPLHFWLVPAYSYAPSVVSALMAATATKVSVYVLIRFLFGVFGLEFPGMDSLLGVFLLGLGLLGALIGTLAAISETDLKRLFAQSSIAQLGYMAIGLGLATKSGLAASFIHLFNHALIKGAIFLALGTIAAQLGRVTMTNIQGAAKQIPMTIAAILFGGLALIGLPLTAGFISKLYLLRAIIEKGAWVVAAFTVLSSILALIYVWRIVEVAYLNDRPKGAPVLTETTAQWIGAWLLVIATIYFGVQSEIVVDAAFAAADMFIGGKQ